jgi:DNA-binding NtrC family response regulator
MSEGAPTLIGTGPRMRAVFDLIASCAECDAPVLIVGESGAGKEVVARAIHAASAPRRSGPFCAMHCALPLILIDSELFGHVKGGGMFRADPVVRPGLFEKARGGTLFLNVIEALPLPAQARVVHALQRRQITRVGDTAVIDVDVRLIASALEDLNALVRDGQFRAELFCWRHVIRIDLPPLRERSEDVPLLAARFAHEFTGEGKTPFAFDSDALQAMCEYDWPGNVRQLRNHVERACLLCEGGTIRREDVLP